MNIHLVQVIQNNFCFGQDLTIIQSFALFSPYHILMISRVGLIDIQNQRGQNTKETTVCMQHWRSLYHCDCMKYCSLWSVFTWNSTSYRLRHSVSLFRISTHQFQCCTAFPSHFYLPPRILNWPFLQLEAHYWVVTALQKSSNISAAHHRDLHSKLLEIHMKSLDQCK